MGKNALTEYSLDTYTYSFYDPIILKYLNGEVAGDFNFFEADTLFVKKSEPLKLVKNKSSA